MKEFNVKTGQRIRDIRTQNNYTREYLAEISDISDNFIYEVETGRRGISAHKLSQISGALNISMDYLVKGSYPPEYDKLTKCLMGMSEENRKIIADVFLQIATMLVDENRK